MAFSCYNRRMDCENIILIGLMGTGKSTVGKELAAALKWDLVDTDQRIEEMAGASIAQIFDSEGEESFRQRETEVLQEVLQGSRQVVVTGGGSVLRPHNRQLMRERGMVIQLQASEQELIRRLSRDQSRPLLRGDVAARIRQLMQERAGLYDFAQLHIQTSGKSVTEVVAEIMRQLDVGQ